MKQIAMLLAASLTACSLLPASRTATDDCTYEDRAFMAWSTTAALAGGLSGAAATAGATVGEHPDAVMGLTITGAVLAAVGTAAGLVAALHGQRFVECEAGVEKEDADDR